MNDIKKILSFIKKIGVIMHPLCAEELDRLIDKARQEDFNDQFYARMRYLEDNPLTYKEYKKWFGTLVSDKNYSKIKFLATIKNERIIFRLYGKPPVAYLLYAFSEKSGNDGSSREYDVAKDIANKRFKEAIESENA